MQQLGVIDTAVFYFINHLPHGWFLDGFFGLVSGLGDSGFIWFLFGIWLYIREKRRDKTFFLPLGIAGILSWFFSEILLKQIVTRLRPSNVLDNVFVVGFPNGYSFPSTHATFAFALAVILSVKEPKLKKFFFILALLVAFSRIYLGYHYPGDVLAGTALGLMIGWGTRMWYEKYQGKQQGKKGTHKNHKKHRLSSQKKHIRRHG